VTRGEALKLKNGDHVEALIGRHRRLARVDMALAGREAGRPAELMDYIYVRQPGRTAAGRRYPWTARRLNDVRATGYRPEPANIYADWLDDNGHPEAAAALREAFPLGDRTP